MLTKILEALHLDGPDSMKRALTTLLGGIAILAINPLLAKWGIAPISDGTIASFAGLIAAFIFQSGMKSKAEIVAKAEAVGQIAADGVTTQSEALAVINQKIAELTAKRAAMSSVKEE